MSNPTRIHAESLFLGESIDLQSESSGLREGITIVMSTNKAVFAACKRCLQQKEEV